MKIFKTKYFYSILAQGQAFEKRIFLLNEKQEKLSFWHDIQLYQNNDKKNPNICIEIPQHTLAKLELCKQEQSNPIKQDTRTNKFNKQEKELRYYAQFPLFNYGFFPQTWENSLNKTNEGYFGDDDPLDVVDLSQPNKKTGDMYQVNVLGCFCLIDQGEVDWKIITINSQEALQNKIQSINDIEAGRINAIKNWFKFIKVFDGKKPNSIHYNEQVFDQDKAFEVIHENHIYWQQLTGKNVKDDKLIQKRKEFNIQ